MCVYKDRFLLFTLFRSQLQVGRVFFVSILIKLGKTFPSGIKDEKVVQVSHLKFSKFPTSASNFVLVITIRYFYLLFFTLNSFYNFKRRLTKL